LRVPWVTEHFGHDSIKTPYRLDLTVSALRRSPTNVVDVYTPDGRYLRALEGRTKPSS
jgi:hypothetical protein